MDKLGYGGKIWQQWYEDVNGSMTSTDFIDILDNSVLDSVENSWEDADVPFIFQVDISPVHTALKVQTWLDKRDVHFQNTFMRHRFLTKLELIPSLFNAWRDNTSESLHKLFLSAQTG